MMRRRTSDYRFLFAGLLALTLLCLTQAVTGQSGETLTGWQPRRRIPGISDLVDWSPYLVADSEGTVHAFHTQPVPAESSNRALVYSTWTPDQGWSEPNDILLPMTGGLIRTPRVFLDKNGMFHLVFYCCDDFMPDIYYSRAWAKEAGDAGNWSAPIMIGPEAKNPASVAITGTDDGGLIVIYGGGPLGKGMYTLHSPDSGQSWSEPAHLFLAFDETLLPYDPYLEMDQSENIHAIWTVNGVGGQGDAIYYARLDAGGSEWSEPLLLAQVDQDRVVAVSSPTIIALDNELVVTYNDWHSVPERFIRKSVDGGKTWSQPTLFLPPTRGEYGPSTFDFDGDGNLHLIMADRGRGRTIWHIIKPVGGQWQEPEPIVPVPESFLYPVGHPLEFHPHRPRMIISRGNVMLVSWRRDPGSGDFGTWYSYVTLDAREQPVVPLPELQSTITTGETAPPPADRTLTQVSPIPSPTVAVASNSGGVPENQVSGNPQQSIVGGLIPVFTFSVIVLGYVLIRRRHS